MARIVRQASELAPIMVVQANQTTRPQAVDGKAEKSSPVFLKKLLEEHGFPRVDSFASPNYSRPLLVGRTAHSV